MCCVCVCVCVCVCEYKPKVSPVSFSSKLKPLLSLLFLFQIELQGSLPVVLYYTSFGGGLV